MTHRARRLRATRGAHRAGRRGDCGGDRERGARRDRRRARPPPRSPIAARSPPDELAARTTTAERYVREWLGAQAASGFACDGPPSYDARRRAITSRYSYRYAAGPSCEPLFAPMANSRKSRSRAAARSGESANAA
jgi:hypothetical protein